MCVFGGGMVEYLSFTLLFLSLVRYLSLDSLCLLLASRFPSTGNRQFKKQKFLFFVFSNIFFCLWLGQFSLKIWNLNYRSKTHVRIFLNELIYCEYSSHWKVSSSDHKKKMMKNYYIYTHFLICFRSVNILFVIFLEINHTKQSSDIMKQI